MNPLTLPSNAHFINEVGFCIAHSMRNLTAVPSIKGQLVKLHSSDFEGFVAGSTSDTDLIGIVLDPGILPYVADTQEQLCRVVVWGACQVLLKTGTTARIGYWVFASATAGYADAQANPGGYVLTGLGRSLQNVVGGSGPLLCWVNFNKPTS